MRQRATERTCVRRICAWLLGVFRACVRRARGFVHAWLLREDSEASFNGLVGLVDLADHVNLAGPGDLVTSSTSSTQACNFVDVVDLVDLVNIIDLVDLADLIDAIDPGPKCQILESLAFGIQTT